MLHMSICLIRICLFLSQCLNNIFVFRNQFSKYCNVLYILFTGSSKDYRQDTIKPNQPTKGKPILHIIYMAYHYVWYYISWHAITVTTCIPRFIGVSSTLVKTHTKCFTVKYSLTCIYENRKFLCSKKSQKRLSQKKTIGQHTHLLLSSEAREKEVCMHDVLGAMVMTSAAPLPLT